MPDVRFYTVYMIETNINPHGGRTMIHEPRITIQCDNCQETETIEPEYKYHNYSGDSGFYDCSDEAIAERAETSQSWVIDDDKHYCCKECMNEATQ